MGIYFNQTGILLQNQWKKWNNRWFYLTDSASLKIEENQWKLVFTTKKTDGDWLAYTGGQTYYLSNDGNMITGWRRLMDNGTILLNQGK